MGGYTERIWKRKENLQRRRWTVSIPAAEQANAADDESNRESPAAAAERFFADFANADDATQAMVRGMIDSKGIESVLETFLIASFKAYDDAFRAEVRRDAIARGIRDVLSRIHTGSLSQSHNAHADASEPTQSNTDDATSKPNQSPSAPSQSPSDASEPSQSAGGYANASVTSANGSMTAGVMANFRSSAHALGFGADSFAGHFAGCAMSAETKAQFARTGFLPHETARTAELQREEPFMCHSMLTFVQSSTCFIDDALARFEEEQREAPHNVVLLGAGYDMRFHRLEFGANAHKFEVDTAATLDVKRRTLESAGLALRDDVVYSKCDFTTQSWLDVLKRDGLDVQRPTFIVWEGVSYYMPPDVVSSKLQSVATQFKAPAAIVFDYLSPRYIEKVCDDMKAIGEPLLFGAEPQRMNEIVQQCGLHVIDRLTNSAGAARYMPVRSDTGESVGVASDHEFFLIAVNDKFSTEIEV